MGRLQEQAGEDLSSSDSDSEEDHEQPADEAAAQNDAHEVQEGGVATHLRSSSNAAGARAAEASGAQGCSSGDGGSGSKARASRAAGAGADTDNTENSLRTYLEIVQSSQLHSEKTSTISALLRTESDQRVLSCFEEKGKWVGTGEGAHFQGQPVWSEVATALLALMPHVGSARAHASYASRASSSRQAELCRARSRTQGSRGQGQAQQAPDLLHQEHALSAPEVLAALPVVTPSASGAGAEDLSARALAQAGDVAPASEGVSEGCASSSAAGGGAAGSAVDACAHVSPGKRLKQGAHPVRVCMYGESMYVW